MANLFALSRSDTNPALTQAKQILNNTAASRQWHLTDGEFSQLLELNKVIAKDCSTKQQNEYINLAVEGYRTLTEGTDMWRVYNQIFNEYVKAEKQNQQAALWRNGFSIN